MSRSLFTKALLLRNLQNAPAITKQIKRNGGHGAWSYRVPPPAPSKFSVRLAYVIGGVCWYWILYHLATEPEHVYGEFPYISPSTWTDEELGIPDVNEGSLKKC